MSTPLRNFMSEFLATNPNMDAELLVNFMRLYSKYEKAEKKMIVNTWENCIMDYRECIATDMINMSGEEYYESLHESIF